MSFDSFSSIHTRDDALIRRASWLSLIVSIVLLAFKFWGYRMTGSQAVFSDAMESIVNVIGALTALVVVAIARKPADKDHPYGHGKVEFFSAAFEGGLIAFASVLIFVEAVQALVRGHEVSELNFGVAIVFGSGVANALLGLYLMRVGKRQQSSAMSASGHHVLSDFWTSGGVAVGLLLVKFTGLVWLDPAVALLMSLVLARTGWKLVRSSVGALLDEEDLEILGVLSALVARDRPPGLIQLHHVRVMRSGHYHHIDAHAVVPEFWSVLEAHDRTEDFEDHLMREYPYAGELHLHMDPCRRAYCRECAVDECPVRQHSFEKRRPVLLEEFTSPTEPYHRRR